MMQAMFDTVLRQEALTSLFQPIVDLEDGKIVGYEGLIRGPVGTPLHSPVELFDAARREGRTGELELLCHRKHIDNFDSLRLPGRLFLNMSPDVVTVAAPTDFRSDSAPRTQNRSGGRIVVELTETSTAASYAQLREATSKYRGMGVQFAIDDLGEGFASLRLWSELRPEFVKIDQYFVRDIDSDSLKRRVVRSIAEIALHSGAILVAEGIETDAELAVVRSLGIQYGQGYLLGRPSAEPAHILPRETMGMLGARGDVAVGSAMRSRNATAGKILREVPTVSNEMPTNEVYRIFQEQAELQVLAVLRDGVPQGLIHRSRMLDRLARPYQRELYGTKPCAHFIENAPLVVDQHTSLQDLAHLFTENNPHHLFEGFIITASGKFAGVGTGFDLLREITQMQMDAARYANPLTQLPGNVPINEHLEMLAHSGTPFAVCYADLDHFKPFNDLYGYRVGDDAIQLTATLLRNHIDPEVDFLGHIGGDDFIVVFRSANWRERCQAIVDGFAATTRCLYRQEHLDAGGYVALNRQGQEVFHQLLSISLGVVTLDGIAQHSSAHISEMAAVAKAQAKKVSGNALFVERRVKADPIH